MSTLTPEPHTPTPLQERIVEKARQAMIALPSPRNPKPTADALARAALEAIAAEVRKAQADALREAAGDIVWSAETLPHMTPHDAARGLVRRAERIEQED